MEQLRQEIVVEEMTVHQLLLVMSEERRQNMDCNRKRESIAQAAAGVSPEIMGIGPVPSTLKALKMAGLTFDDIGLIELNEAFSAQALPSLKNGILVGIK